MKSIQNDVVNHSFHPHTFNAEQIKYCIHNMVDKGEIEKCREGKTSVFYRLTFDPVSLVDSFDQIKLKKKKEKNTHKKD